MRRRRGSGASFSRCGTYRYALWRVWDEAAPLLNVIGLNPSTADATRDDPTIRRCVAFARRWGYGGVVVTNLFAFRAIRPVTLARAPDPVGPRNDRVLSRHATRADGVLAAWGAKGSLRGRDAAVLAALRGRPLWSLGRTSTGAPRHPLYVRADALPLRF